MDKEELIEAARVAYIEAWETEDRRIENWDRDSRGRHTRSRAGIVAALTVFEASLQIEPAFDVLTLDEIEWLIRVIEMVKHETELPSVVAKLTARR